MSVSTTNVFNEYVAAGGVNFNITFYVRSSTWLTVTVDGVPTGAYTDALNPDQNTVPGGLLTFLSAPTSGAIIRIMRTTPVLQPDVYAPNSPLPAQTIEYDFDRGICIAQELAYNLANLLPTPYISGWVLGATSPTTLAWVPGGGGGGGGGISIIGAPIAGQTNAALISGTGGDTLQLGIADSTHPGILSLGTQNISGEKHFEEGATSHVFDIRNYGAISSPHSNIAFGDGVHDCSDAIEAAIAAWTQTAGNTFASTANPVGGIYFPIGNWYISRPIIPPSGCTLYGDGPDLSNIVAGGGSEATPLLVQGFGGPVIAAMGASPVAAINTGTNLPDYTTPLVGATGRSLKINNYDSIGSPAYFPVTITLDDCYGWCEFLQWTAGQLRLRFWVDVAVQPVHGSSYHIIGSFGGQFNPDTPTRNYSAIGVGATGNIGATAVNFTANLTTYNNGLIEITSGDFAVGIHYIELSYDGSNFWFYVDGVHQGHQAMTGRVDKKPIESVTIGQAIGVFRGFSPITIDGSIFSVELGKVAGHTGTGSYTPPVAKHAADSNTLWLMNCDQGEPPLAPFGRTAPFLLAETVITNGSGFGQPTGGAAATAPATTGMNPHYCRLTGSLIPYLESYGPSYMQVRDLAIICSSNASGLLCRGAPHCNFTNLLITQPLALGLDVSDPHSFFSSSYEIKVQSCFGVGILHASSTLNDVVTIGCGVGTWLVYGVSENVQDQPVWNSFIPNIYGGGSSSISGLSATGHSNDEEGACPYQVAGIYIIAPAAMTFQQCFWDVGLAGDAFGGLNPPVVLVGGMSATGNIRMNGCIFRGPNSISGPVATITTDVQAVVDPNARIVMTDCDNQFVAPGTLWSDIANLVVEVTPTTINGQKGISTTAVSSNNLAGQFNILHGYTTGRIQFPVPEPDGNYTLTFGLIGFDGSAPAAGSTTIIGYTNDADGTGSNVTVGADPGGTCQLRIGWTLIRTPGLLFRDYAPSAGSITNPLVAASPTGDWCVGATLEPVGVNALGYLSANPTEAIASAGTPAAANSWGLTLQGGARVTVDFGTAFGQLDAFTDRGRMYCIMSPGVHNVCFGNVHNIFGKFVSGWQGATPISATFIDGGVLTNRGPGFFPTGTQQTPLWIAEHAGATDVLTVATLRNFQIGTDPALVVTIEPDAGPQSGDLESAIFGDSWAIGIKSAASTQPSWASQIADARYGGKYVWMALTAGQTIVNSTVPDFWMQWAAALGSGLTDICVATGLYDIIGGGQASDIMATLTTMMDGGNATVLVSPPTNNIQGTTILYTNTGPTTPISGTLTVQAVAFPITFVTDKATTMQNLVNAVNASSPTNTLVVATLIADSNILLTCLLPGSQCSTVSLASSVDLNLYPGPGPMTGGLNAVITIQGVTFQFYFLTDADTSIDAVITLINASAPTLALVTPTRVSSRLLLTAVTPGVAGNAITVTTNSIAGCAPVGNITGHMLGGFDGAIQSGIGNIVIANVPPFGDYFAWTSGKETQRTTLNASIAAFCTAHAGDGVVLADVDGTVRDAGDHTKVDPAFLDADDLNPSDAGQTALFGLFDPLLP